MTFRLKSVQTFAAITIIVAICSTLIYIDRIRMHEIVENKVNIAVEEEVTRRQKQMDELFEKQQQAILQSIEKVEQLLGKVTPIPHSGPGIPERPPVENIETLMRQLAYHFRFREGTFITSERVLICDDIGAGTMFLINFTLDRNSVNNRTDIVVLSPKPQTTHPHNPPAVLSAKYVDPASSEQIEEIIYETEFVGGKYYLFANVQLFGARQDKDNGHFSYVQILAK